jgi:RNA polymerase sigma factor (sigma-70 family)
LPETALLRRQELARSYRESGEVLVKMARPGLIQVARKLGLDLAAAKDVAQQAFASLFAQRPTIDNLEAWLTKVVLCRANDWLRDHGKRNQVCLTTIPEEPVAQLSEDQRLAILTVLGRLPKRYRLLVEARYFEGHTEEEAAQLAGLSPASYKKTMTRALQRMREELERGCREMPAGRRKLP